MPRILVIDDDLAIRSHLELILKREGYEVKSIESASDLEAVVAAFAPEVVICDLMMPGRDGLAVCRALKENHETRHIKVLIASSKSFESDKRSALNAGATGYIVKPIREAEFINTVRQAVAAEVSVKIWGARGSIPTPEKAQGLYGGNTPCITVEVPGRGLLIFDAGTGLRPLGHHLAKSPLKRISLFITHFHWDHIFGLPFFVPLYLAGNEVHLYAPASSNEALAEKIEKQMGGDYFPVSTEVFRAAVKFHALQQEQLEVEGISISTFYAFHPGTTLMYRVNLGDRSLVYAPDNEIFPETTTPELTGEARKLVDFVAGTSLLIHDCAYSNALYKTRREWGHCSPAALGAVAQQAQVKKVLLFHHDPDSSDEQVQAINQELQEAVQGEIPSEPAREGSTQVL